MVILKPFQVECLNFYSYMRRFYEHLMLVLCSSLHLTILCIHICPYTILSLFSFHK